MGSKQSGNRSRKPRAKGAGRKPSPPRIDRAKQILVINVRHLTPDQQTKLLEQMRQLWQETQGAKTNETL